MRQRGLDSSVGPWGCEIDLASAYAADCYNTAFGGLEVGEGGVD